MWFFGAALKGLTFLALGSSVFAAPSNQKRQNDTDAGADGHWVPTWVSMPQLVEPNNLPPAPFVRFSPSQEFALVGPIANHATRNRQEGVNSKAPPSARPSA